MSVEISHVVSHKPQFYGNSHRASVITITRRNSEPSQIPVSPSHADCNPVSWTHPGPVIIHQSDGVMTSSTQCCPPSTGKDHHNYLMSSPICQILSSVPKQNLLPLSPCHSCTCCWRHHSRRSRRQSRVSCPRACAQDVHTRAWRHARATLTSNLTTKTTQKSSLIAASDNLFLSPLPFSSFWQRYVPENVLDRRVARWHAQSPCPCYRVIDIHL